jgi:di/tricarboxylate transporter
LLGGVLPLGIAMQNSGLATFIAEQTVALVGDLGPVAILAAFYILTALLTECMSNNASAVLLAPIAISTAIQMDINPKPLLFGIMFAASTSFATPVGYQTNMMVYSPGGYRFTDFMRVGTPLIVIFGIVSVYFIPKFWPF